MATEWVKSLHCRSRAFQDVHNPNPKHPNLISPTASCRRSVESIKDVIEITKKHKPSKPKSNSNRKPSSKPKRIVKPENNPVLYSTSVRTGRNHDRLFPTLTELPDGHPSRNVVEIIFHTSWLSPAFKPLPVRLEVIFKIHNLPRTVSRFEEYREMVKSRAEDDVRCIADGNEMMRFHCLGTTTSGVMHDFNGGAWVFPNGKCTGICTFAGSGLAHESFGGYRGGRAMLVCRVIAGRVKKQRVGVDLLLKDRVEFDSVSGDNGELLVFDSHAVLPCFLIVYKF